MELDRAQGLIDWVTMKGLSRNAAMAMADWWLAQGQMTQADVDLVAEALDAAEETGEPVSLRGMLAENAALEEGMTAAQVMAASVMTDAQVLDHMDVWPGWEVGTAYRAGQVVRHEGGLYRVVQAVTAMEHQPPGSTGMLAIYRPVQVEAGPGEVLPWVSGEEVSVGDLRLYNGVTYECYTLAGANVHSPDLVASVWRVVEG